MRTFIAIELSPQIKDFLAQLQGRLKTSGSDVKWVGPQNIHLTLKFLGETDEAGLEKITALLEEIAQNTKPFPIRLASAGAFPKLKFPRVIWAGIDKGDSEVKKIAQGLEEKIAKAKIGIPNESKPFSSHITLGRVRSGLNRERLVENLETLISQPGEYFSGQEFTVTKITLFKSTLTPKGPIYEILKEANFALASA